MRCKYCGIEVRNSGTLLMGSGSGQVCPSSPSKKHVLANNISNRPLHCKYCGIEVRNSGISLAGRGSGTYCPSSPNKKHQLN